MIVYINQILIIYRQIFKSYFDAMMFVSIYLCPWSNRMWHMELNVGFLDNYSSSLLHFLSWGGLQCWVMTPAPYWRKGTVREEWLPRACANMLWCMHINIPWVAKPQPASHMWLMEMCQLSSFFHRSSYKRQIRKISSFIIIYLVWIETPLD